MAYTSKIKLEIGEVPKTTDAELLPDLLDITNSIHILAQYTNRLIELREEDNDPDQSPDKLKPVKKALDGIVKETVKAGQFIWPSKDADGWILGAPVYQTENENPPTGTNLHGRIPVGIAMENASAWTRIPIAMGPGILKVSGSVLGQDYYLNRNPTTRGYLTTSPSWNAPPIPIAVGIGNGYVLVFDSLAW